MKRKKKIYRYLKVITSLLIFALGFSVGAHAEIALEPVVANLSAPLYYADPN